ncbi:response regulator [Rhizobium sp. RAF56]|jgi:CheY-like chemotaxis protein|uniref:response regulator n=1 Tax=Rhizobium sp. RAF56 TaxID=3233062 RepID=UPI003F96B60A
MAQAAPPKRPIVLVVEDHPLQRMMAVAIVEGAGFEAVEAISADEAVSILEARTDIRIVFTDIEMPGSMDGMKLAAAIRDRWPPIEIIITSGHFMSDKLALPARTEFYAKPYREADIVAALHRFGREEGYPPTKG